VVTISQPPAVGSAAECLSVPVAEVVSSVPQLEQIALMHHGIWTNKPELKSH
jgi:hypothetical protein